MCQRSILWFSLSEATPLELQANLRKPLLKQHQLSKTNSKHLSVGRSWGLFRVLVESGFRGILALVRRDSAFRGKGFELVRGIWALAGRDSGFRGEGLREIEHRFRSEVINANCKQQH